MMKMNERRKFRGCGIHDARTRDFCNTPPIVRSCGIHDACVVERSNDHAVPVTSATHCWVSESCKSLDENHDEVYPKNQGMSSAWLQHS